MKLTQEQLQHIIKEEFDAVVAEKASKKARRKKRAKVKKKKAKKAGGGDRCTRIAKRKYDVWPSAYASGAVVKCRQGKIWKGLKEVLSEDDFKEVSSDLEYSIDNVGLEEEGEFGYEEYDPAVEGGPSSRPITVEDIEDEWLVTEGKRKLFQKEKPKT